MPIPLETAAARMICAGFHEQALPSSLREPLDRGLGFVVLFARNVASPSQVRQLTDDIRDASGRPIPICVDQEGGRVRRLRDGFTPIPSMRDLGAMNDPTLARELGQVIAAEVKAAGFDVDFAPVLDVDTNPANPVIADRSLARDPHTVASLGTQLIAGIQSQSVAACAKHFPGHGDTSQDSHHHLPRLDHDLPRLRSIELVPFVAAVNAGVASIMTSHIIFSPLDPARPATLSPRVLHEILRNELAYNGVIFTDDMEMKALADHFDFDQAVIDAILAGADVLTICHSLEKQHRAIDVIVRAVERREIALERIMQSVLRIESLTRAYAAGARPPVSSINSDAHRRVAGRVNSVSVALPDPTKYKC
jgi:beta-N-acetylhexosaminidase